MFKTTAITRLGATVPAAQLVASAIGLLLCGALAWPGAARWAYDDPYITYRYAQNLLSGLGFVYNPGLRVLSTTTPGYTLLLAGLGTLWPDLPLLSNLLGLLAILGAWLLVVALLPADQSTLPAALVALLMGLLAPAYTALGSEMPLYTLLILVSLLLAERRRPLWAGVIAGLATVVRPDGALVAAVVAATFWRQPRALLLAAAGAALAAGPWYLFSLGYFGSLIPATLAAKRAQLAQIAGSPSFLDRLGQTLAAYARQPWYWSLLPCLACGAWALVRQRRLPLIIAWALLYVAAYSALGVSGYSWYLVPIFPALIWLAGYGVWWLGKSSFSPARHGDTEYSTGDVFWPSCTSGGAWRRSALTALGALLLTVPAIGAAQGLERLLARAPEPRTVIYTEVGSWLATNTPPRASVGALEVGIIGYHSRRTMIDFAGLIQPEVAAGAGKSYRDWGEAAIQRYRPDFVAVPAALGTTLSSQPWFAASYHALKQFAVPGFDGPLVVYERR